MVHNIILLVQPFETGCNGKQQQQKSLLIEIPNTVGTALGLSKWSILQLKVELESGEMVLEPLSCFNRGDDVHNG